MTAVPGRNCAHRAPLPGSDRLIKLGVWLYSVCSPNSWAARGVPARWRGRKKGVVKHLAAAGGFRESNHATKRGLRVNDVRDTRSGLTWDRYNLSATAVGPGVSGGSGAPALYAGDP